MNVTGINFVIDKHGYSGSNRLIYDFRNYTIEHVSSVPSGASKYSGQITATSSAARDSLTGSLGQTDWSGGIGGYNQKIEVQNPSDLFTGGEFSMFFQSHQYTKFQIGQSDQTPLNKRNVIFSNLSGQGSIINGWEIGLNSTNSVYIKTYSLNQPRIVTYTGIPFGDNLWGVRSSNGAIKLSRFDPFFNRAENQEHVLPNSINAGYPWTIGSGNLGGQNALNTGLNNGETFAGNIKGLVYIDQFLDDNESEELMRSWVGSPVYSSLTGTGDAFAGYSYSNSVTTGNVGYIPILSGFVSGAVQQVQNVTYSGVSGLVGNGSGYYLPFDTISGAGNDFKSGVGTLYRQFYNTGASFSGITCLEPITGNVTVSGSIPVYTLSGVTGFLSISGGISYTGNGTTFVESTGSIGQINSSALYPRSFSYLGESYTNDFVEVVSGLESLVNGVQTTNKYTSKAPSTVYRGQTNFLRNQTSYSGINMFINGVAYRYGDINVSLTNDAVIINPQNPTEVTIIDESGNATVLSGQQEPPYTVNGKRAIISLGKDFGVTGQIEIYNNFRFTGLSEQKSLFGVYDILQPSGAVDRQELVISNTGDYTGIPFSEISPSGKQVFFNGQKIYHGINYTGQTDFYPIGYLTGVTGIYHTMPNFSGSESYTGINSGGNRNLYSQHGDLYKPFSKSVYINGVRQPYWEYAQHDLTKDMISGVWTEDKSLKFVTKKEIVV